MLHSTRPSDFQSKKAGAICFLEHENKFLLMKRATASYQGGLWTAAPGGKLDPGETPVDGVIREVWEETGISLNQKKLTFIQTVYFQFPEKEDLEYALHLFYYRLEAKPKINLAINEHTEYCWDSLQEALKLPLMRGGRECLEFIQQKLHSLGQSRK